MDTGFVMTGTYTGKGMSHRHQLIPSAFLNNVVRWKTSTPPPGFEPKFTSLLTEQTEISDLRSSNQTCLGCMSNFPIKKRPHKIIKTDRK
jgi:hypothetical protein